MMLPPRDRALMRQALTPIAQAARSRLDFIDRDIRRCSTTDKLRLAELKGERGAWSNILTDIRCRLVKLSDDDHGTIL